MGRTVNHQYGAIFGRAGWNGQYRISDNLQGTNSLVINRHESNRSYASNTFEIPFYTEYQFERFQDSDYSRFESGKLYRVYIGVYFSSNNYNQQGNKIVFIDRIEGLMTRGEAEAIATQRRQEGEAIAQQRRQAEAEAREALQNPNNVDRNMYNRISVQDFSFDMVTGRLPVGAKVTFTTRFITRPTGTRYLFRDINQLITISTQHNFVRDIPDNTLNCMRDVRIYLTITRSGETGTATVDIVEW